MAKPTSKATAGSQPESEKVNAALIASESVRPRQGAIGFRGVVSETTPDLDRSPVGQLEHDLRQTRLALEMSQVDVNVLKQADVELRRVGEYASAIVENVPPLLILNRNLRVVTANTSFYNHFRVSRAQTENLLIYDLGNGQWNIPRLKLLLEDILPRNSFFKDFEITHEFPGLGARTILLSGRKVDHPPRILVNIEDVTERLHFQLEIRRSEMRYRRLFEAAKVGILIFEPENRKITDCNPFIQELLGFDRQELLGKELWQIGLLKDESASREAFARLQTEGYIHYEDLPFQTKSGLPREVEFVGNLYFESHAQVIQCNIRDISARKKIEFALAAANKQISLHAAQLEEQVEERTAKLRETIGELEIFSYSVAHDMRAPLRAMEGFTQILLDDIGNRLNSEEKQHLTYIASAAVRMDMLIQDVLTYTTVLRTEIKMSVVDLNVLLRQVIHTYPQLHHANVQIVIEGPLPRVWGHAAAISQCISNLLTNAVKFVAAGTAPLVKVHAEEHGSFVRLWVDDNGIGIDQKDHERIFGMFVRVHNEYEGTGIGLTIVRKSVERLGGKVGLESAVDAGSRFWLEFKKIT